MTSTISRRIVLAATVAGTILFSMSCTKSSGQPLEDLRVGQEELRLSFPAADTDQVTYLAGGLLPCLTHGGPVEVTSVTSDSGVQSAQVKYFVRRIPTSDKRTPGQPIDWAPIVSLDGSLQDAVSEGVIRGEVDPLDRGQKFDLGCHDGDRDVDAAMDEIIFQVHAGSAGAEISNIEVNYQRGDRTGSAKALMTVRVCGKEVNSPQCDDWARSLNN